MSNKPIIRVEHVSKQYRLGQVGTKSLNADLNRWWHTRVRGREDPYLKIGEINDRQSKGNSDYVWALKDVNFEIQPGEVVGIIGRNGAGKSTLLKILSRTTSPTTGKVFMKGRVASLLEVGTGFHPDLSGRENIFLNGAILGMNRKEILKKFDEIVDFAAIERYVDTPVKRYSSGMYVRLAFAVAAHLEPEILIVDEVLAVGDAEFQKKCLGKMNEVSTLQGRTVLFVSHQMGMIQKLCKRGIWMRNGTIAFDGNVMTSIERYLSENSSNAAAMAAKSCAYFDVCLTDKNDKRQVEFSTSDKLHFSFHLKPGLLPFPVTIGIAFKDFHGNKLFTIKRELAVETDQFKCMLLPDQLAPGSFKTDIAIFKGKADTIYYGEDVLEFKIIDGGTEFSEFEGIDYGKVFLNAEWNV